MTLKTLDHSDILYIAVDKNESTRGRWDWRNDLPIISEVDGPGSVPDRRPRVKAKSKRKYKIVEGGWGTQ